jgi:hypothetical protein
MGNAQKGRERGKKAAMEKLAPNWMTPKMMEWLSKRLNTDIEVLLSETEVMVNQAKEGENNGLISRGDADAKVWKAANLLAYQDALEGILRNIPVLKKLSDHKLQKEFSREFTVSSKQIDNFTIMLAQKERKYRGDSKWVRKPIEKYSEGVLREARALAGGKPASLKSAPRRAPEKKVPALEQFAASAPMKSEKKKQVAKKVAVEAQAPKPVSMGKVKNPKKKVEEWLRSSAPEYPKLNKELSILMKNEERATRARAILGKRGKRNSMQREMYQEALFAKRDFSSALVPTLLKLIGTLKEKEARFAREAGRNPQLAEAYEKKIAETEKLFQKYTEMAELTGERINSNRSLLDSYEAWKGKMNWGSVVQSQEKASQMLAEAKAGRRRKAKMTLEELRGAAKERARNAVKELIEEKKKAGELELSGKPGEMESLTNSLIAQAEKDADEELALAAARFRAPAAASEVQVAQAGGKKETKVSSLAPKKEKKGFLDGIFSFLFGGGEGEA